MRWLGIPYRALDIWDTHGVDFVADFRRIVDNENDLVVSVAPEAKKLSYARNPREIHFSILMEAEFAWRIAVIGHVYGKLHPTGSFRGCAFGVNEGGFTTDPRDFKKTMLARALPTAGQARDRASEACIARRAPALGAAVVNKRRPRNRENLETSQKKQLAPQSVDGSETQRGLIVALT